jgi:hypothetical protein
MLLRTVVAGRKPLIKLIREPGAVAPVMVDQQVACDGQQPGALGSALRVEPAPSP